METNLQEAKATLRTQIRARLPIIPSGQRASLSKDLCDRILAQPVWRAARSVLLFAAAADEPNIWPLRDDASASGKTVALPHFVSPSQGYAAREWRGSPELIPGKFNILEPRPSCPEVPLNQLDLVLVPGVAFDLHGHRLGRGKGYYDRLLGAVRGTKCGVAFDEQIVEAIPVEPHDIQLNCIVTPTRWIECNG